MASTDKKPETTLIFIIKHNFDQLVLDNTYLCVYTCYALIPINLRRLEMVKRLSITIPDNVYERLEGYRDIISISTVCSEAIKKEMDNIDRKDKLALRAKKRLELYDIINLEKACNIAYEEGVEWATNKAALEELAFVCEFNENIAQDFDRLKIRDEYQNLFEDVVSENHIIKDLYNNYEYPWDFISDQDLSSVIGDFMNEDNEDIEVGLRFADGAITIWKKIRREALKKLLVENHTEYAPIKFGENDYEKLTPPTQLTEDKNVSSIIDNNTIEILLRNNSPMRYNLIPVQKNRRFFPGYMIKFILETDIGEIPAKVTSAPKGTKEGDPDGGHYIKSVHRNGLTKWYKQHKNLKLGDKISIKVIEDKQRYKLSVAGSKSR